MHALVQLLKQKHLTIASIESLTAGLFASSLAEVPGASNVLKGALVTYQTRCKEEVLHVDKDIILTYGVISKEVAEAMVLQGKKMFHSDIVVSFTGNAGPDVMDEKEGGLVHMSVLYQEELSSFAVQFKGSRNEIRKQAVSYLSKEIMKILK